MRDRGAQKPGREMACLGAKAPAWNGGFRLSCRAMAETGLFALALPAFLGRHLLDLAVLSAAAVVTTLRPRAAPYLAVVAVLFPSAATSALKTDGLVLAGVAAGLAIDRARRRDRAIRTWSGRSSFWRRSTR